jgi:hypothetical protein
MAFCCILYKIIYFIELSIRRRYVVLIIYKINSYLIHKIIWTLGLLCSQGSRSPRIKNYHVSCIQDDIFFWISHLSYQTKISHIGLNDRETYRHVYFTHYTHICCCAFYTTNILQRLPPGMSFLEKQADFEFWKADWVKAVQKYPM